MCATCGCSDRADDQARPLDHHHHDGTPPHEHLLSHEHDESRLVRLEQDILAKNNHIADHNRARFHTAGVLAVNLMSSPGAGKTTLLERTARDLRDDVAVSVIEGDQETALDAARIEAAGVAAVQVNTGSGCHLDADMVRRSLDALPLHPGAVLFVENVGNLVCPALFDLGEEHRVVLTSVTEGADKPAKYPAMFARASIVVLNKIDLLPYVGFDLDAFHRDLRAVNPGVDVFTVSATNGEGLSRWYHWLHEGVGRLASQADAQPATAAVGRP